MIDRILQNTTQQWTMMDKSGFYKEVIQIELKISPSARKILKVLLYYRNAIFNIFWELLAPKLTENDFNSFSTGQTETANSLIFT